MRAYIYLSILFCLLITSCSIKNPSEEYQQKLAENESQIQKYIADSNYTAIKSGSLYIIKRIQNSTGRVPKTGEKVIANAGIFTLSGIVVDTLKQKTIPYNYLNLIYDLPLSSLKLGEKSTFLLPFSLGFGPTPYFNVPDYSPLRVELEVLKIQNEEEQIVEYLSKQTFTNPVELTASGLRIIRTLANPSGVVPTVGKTVKVKYTGKTLAGTVFDTNVKTGTYFSVVIGGSSAIKGFQEGIEKLKIGEKAILIFPSSLGYGATGNAIISPYTSLIFEVEVSQ